MTVRPADFLLVQANALAYVPCERPNSIGSCYVQGNSKEPCLPCGARFLLEMVRVAKVI